MAQEGTVYLIHFDQPYKHARHYIGWSAQLDARLEHHKAGTGARLMAAVAGAGIGWSVVRTWQAGRDFERKLHNRHGAAPLCPICREAAKRK